MGRVTLGEIQGTPYFERRRRHNQESANGTLWTCPRAFYAAICGPWKWSVLALGHNKYVQFKAFVLNNQKGVPKGGNVIVSECIVSLWCKPGFEFKPSDPVTRVFSKSLTLILFRSFIYS